MMLPKLTTLLSPVLALTVTAGAMFVTVNASTAQDATITDVAPVAVIDAEQPPVPQPPVDPASVLHDRQHHVALDANGGFTGQLVSLSGGGSAPADSMSVMVLRNGDVVASAVSDADGTFNVSGVGAGVVSVLATGQNGLLLFSVRLLDEGNVFADATPVKLKSEALELGMRTAVVNAADVATIKGLIFGALPTGDDRFGSELTDLDHQYPQGGDIPSTTINHHPVQLQDDGTLTGQVNLLDPRSGHHRDVVDLTVHFVKDGQHVGATQVQPDGQFMMSGLALGRYSIATTGRDGILAMGIDIVGALANVEKDDEFKLTSIAQSLGLAVSPSQPGDFNTKNAQPLLGDSPLDGEYAGGDMPLPPGGPFAGTPGGGGGIGGGGGGVGGGGGLGALLGAAAAGAIGYAIGNDDAASPNR